MTLSAQIVAQLRATQLGSNDFGGPQFSPTMEKIVSLSIGTGADQADILWMDERSVGTGANDDLDLNGVLTNAFGATINAVEIVALFIINEPRAGSPANTTNLTVGSGTNPVTGYLGGTTPTLGPIRPGNFVLFGGGNVGGFGVVTASTGDILRIANSSGASATYQIAILARSA
jgi:hypothetical protein